MEDSDNDFVKELEALFADEPQSQEENKPDASSSDGKDNKDSKEDNKDIDGKEITPSDSTKEINDMTANVSKRINEVREKTERDTLDRVAREAGFENYAAMQKANQEKLLKDKLQSVDTEVDTNKLSPIIEELVKKQVEEHPDVKAVKEEKLRIFAKEQLEELNKLTGEKFTLNSLPADVKTHWSKSGNLKASYLALHGESLITKVRASNMKGNTSHLDTPSGSAQRESNAAQGRLLTDAEKRYYKSVNPHITDEQLNKKRI